MNASADTKYNLAISVVDARMESTGIGGRKLMPKPRSRVAVLKAVRELISDKKNWMKGEFKEEVTEKGAPYFRYCSVGALQEIDGPAQEAATRELAKTILREYPEMGYPDDAEDTIITWNDGGSTKHENVIKMFDKTIERLGG